MRAVYLIILYLAPVFFAILEVFMMVNIEFTVLWDVTPCSLVDCYRRLGITLLRKMPESLLDNMVSLLKYCDMMPESRNSEIRRGVHCQATTL
jgi:hypothetical protein